MAHSKSYIHTRLMELALIAETRPLDELEKEEEKALTKELDTIYGRDR